MVTSSRIVALTAASLFASAVSGTDATTSQCCDALKEIGFGSKLHLPGTTTYENRTTTYYSRANFLHPHCLIQPESTADVSEIIKVLSAKQCIFAVRSGGHTPNAGANNIDDGVTIDLSHMNTTTYHAENSTASIQPGSRWGPVYRTLEGQGVTVAGGRAASVGVGGFILGGGISYYSAKKGLVCDSVQRYEVVLANGDIVYADKDHHSDLFRALKGGSSNFGIVTRFDLETFPATPIWGGAVMYPTVVEPQMIDLMSSFTSGIDDDPASSSILIWYYLPDFKDTFLVAAYENNEGVAEAPTFKDYLAVQPQITSTTRITNWTSITEELVDPDGLEKAWFTLTFKNDVRIMQKTVELHTILMDEMKTIAGDDGFTSMCMLQPLPASLGRHAAAKGGNVLGLERVEENAILLLATLGTTDSSLASIVEQKVQDWVNAVEDYAKSLDANIEYRFLNYAHGNQNPLGSYGSDNVAKMKKVAAKYDPDGVFQNLLPGGFKISHVKDNDDVPVRDEL
ncbi:hypothetical protein E8E14_009484 [Neopestalotiopsis sp. 37M]|nr:hypothetical protein E8E14_009484 [Neopestalotiopsis sp. 37M]